MVEYIDREATIEFIRLNYCKDCNSYNGVRCRACSFDDAMLAVEDVPAADVVEVVRCKECEYRTQLMGKSPFAFYACSHDKGLGDNVREDDFCSYGVRKGGESDA